MAKSGIFFQHKKRREDASLVLITWFVVVMLFIPTCSCSLTEEAGNHDNNQQVVGGGGRRCIESERRALLDIEQGIYDHHLWRTEGRRECCCCWQGVVCDNVTGHVIELHLQYPYQYNAEDPLAGIPHGASKLSASLLTLTELLYLNLSYNNFSASPIPRFIGSLVNLRVLDLSYTMFTGTIPHQLGNLSSLQVLTIDYNFLDDYAPPTLHSHDLHWLSHLTSLTQLNLRGVNLSQAVDWIHDINMLPNLSILNLWNTYLSITPSTITQISNNTFSSSLTVIDLSWNNFQSPFPGWLHNNISSLLELHLSYCGFYGGLHLSSSGTNHVNSLQVLDLSGNQFGSEVFENLESLSNLRLLDLSRNPIEGSISNSLSNLTHLKHLDVGLSSITGCLPTTLGNLTQLQYLDFGVNNLTGRILESIGSLHSLETLILGENQFSGHIPQSIGKLYKLKKLDLSSNFISGQIPESILGELHSLESLDLSCNQISGSIPKNNVSLPSLEYLSVSQNLLNGEIPPALANSSSMLYLDGSHNKIEDKIPIEFGNLDHLKFLDLSNNRLTGPMFQCSLRSLTFLDLSNNNLCGTLPSFHNKSSSLVVLNLSNNSLSGKVPDPFGQFPALRLLHLGSNNLSGEIPAVLKHIKNLFTLDLSGNSFSGSIPTWIGESLSSLAILCLRSNRLSGHIPIQLSYLPQLQVLDLSHNNFTGNLSLRLDRLHAMAKTQHAEDFLFTVFGDMEHEESIQLITKGILSTYTRILSAVVIIDLSCNNLSGEIPDAITKLVGLEFLNLSRNHFVGGIPQDIGLMGQLEALDLSTNNLSGGIPSSMLALHFLSNLNLSNNNLSGVIPSGNQFSTFTDPSIYRGNVGLCGWPLQNCTSSAPLRSSPDINDQRAGNDKSGKTEMYIGAIIGFIVSYSSFFFIIMVKQSLRCAYFYYIDKLLDLVYVKVVVWWRLKSTDCPRQILYPKTATRLQFGGDQAQAEEGCRELHMVMLVTLHCSGMWVSVCSYIHSLNAFSLGVCSINEL